MPEKISFEIHRHVAVLSSTKNGWNKELNIVSWNGGKKKWEIRDWAPNHERAGKGAGLTAEELAVLKEYLEDLDPYEIEE